LAEHIDQIRVGKQVQTIDSLYARVSVTLITGPHNGPVLFCSQTSVVVVCHRL